jgi:3-hexulose-6-phosphate synthase
LISIQLALDTVPITELHNLNPIFSSLRVIDVIEIGTPMLTRYGLKYFEDLSERIDTSRIYVDLKVCDFLDTHLMPYIDLGARQFSAQFGINSENLELLAGLCSKHNLQMYFSSMCFPIEALEAEANFIKSFGFTNFIAHGQGLTRQGAFADMNSRLKELLKVSGGSLIAGGGISCDNVSSLKRPSIVRIIVGRGWSSQSDPLSGYRALVDALS